MSNMGGEGSWLSQAMEAVKGAGGAETVAPSAVSALSDTAPSYGGLVEEAVDTSQGFGPLVSEASEAAPAAAAGGGGGGFMDTVGQAAKIAVPALKLGTGALGIYSGVKGMGEASQQRDTLARAQKAQMKAAEPAAAFASKSLADAAAGNVPPAQAAQIEEWKQQAKNRVRQYLASSGQLNSSAAQDWENWIERQATAMAGQALETQTSQGLQASSIASGAASNAAQTAQGQAGGLEGAIKGANDVLAQLAAMGQ